MGYVCKNATIDELNQKLQYELDHASNKENWIVWKRDTILRYQSHKIIPYFGILDGKIISECSAAISKDIVQNADGLVDEKTAYLYAFRTIPEFQGQGYFSILFQYMLEDLKTKGYYSVTLGVEPEEKKNKSIYQHYGFTEFIKKDFESYPDGTKVEVEYYKKDL